VTAALAHAKINLALVVGPRRQDGKHEVATLLQRIELADRIELEPADELVVEGFAEDTIVGAALDALAGAAGIPPRWRVRIDKQIPVAAGLGGGSSDAATALRLANDTLPGPLDANALHDLAARLGADVPFFFAEGPQLGTGDGSTFEPAPTRRDYTVLLVLPDGAAKASTAAVYADFDARAAAAGFETRRAALRTALAASDLAALPPNDLARSPLAADLRAAGAFRADVTGAGPAVYGLFESRADADVAERALRARGRSWITRPAW
jgi:4-diphosphocytidyl-2-C-methyl-D-erythritol kinase